MATAWKELFAAALAEENSEHLPHRIESARVAIMERVDDLLDYPDRQPEHDEIIEALNRLARLEVPSRHEI